MDLLRQNTQRETRTNKYPHFCPWNCILIRDKDYANVIHLQVAARVMLVRELFVCQQ